MPESREAALDKVRERIVEATHEQAALLEVASGAVSGLQADLSVQSERLGEARQVLDAAREGTRLGRHEVEALAATLDEVSAMVGRLDEALSVVARVHDRTDAIREIITDIRMLGLNAAIESARAGAAGQGFAVVAASMRELARSGARVADEITTVVTEGLDEVGEVTRTAQAGLEEQARRIGAVQEAFDTVEGRFDTLDGTLGGLERSCGDQAARADQTREALQRQMEDASGRSAELVGLLTGTVVVDWSPEEAHRRLGDVVVVDVRQPEEWTDELGHIDVAQHIPIASDDFADRLARLDRRAPTLFVCRRGGRSARGARVAVELGFAEVYNMAGGMTAWREAGLPSVGRRRAA